MKTALLHPGQGRRTQMFRRNVNMNLLATLFENPRTHTGKGYQKKTILEYRLEYEKQDVYSSTKMSQSPQCSSRSNIQL